MVVSFGSNGVRTASGYGRARLAVSLVLTLATVACDPGEPLDLDTGRLDGGSARDAAAPGDAGPASGGGMGGSTSPATGGAGGSVPQFNPPPPFVPQPPDACYLKVAATCDGDEDCGRGEVCCGEFDAFSFTYTSIGCRASCDPGLGQYRMCHPGDVCVQPGQVCRRSRILPYSELAVCASPSVDGSGEMTGRSIEGEVVCGDRTCGAGLACCFRARFDATRASGSFTEVLEPYCVEDQAECGCDFEPAPDPDADAG